MTQKHPELGFLFFYAIMMMIIIQHNHHQLNWTRSARRRATTAAMSPTELLESVNNSIWKYKYTNTQIQILKYKHTNKNTQPQRHKQFYFYQENILKSPSGSSIKLMQIAEGCKDDTTVQLKVGFCKCFGNDQC